MSCLSRTEAINMISTNHHSPEKAHGSINFSKGVFAISRCSHLPPESRSKIISAISRAVLKYLSQGCHVFD